MGDRGNPSRPARPDQKREVVTVTNTLCKFVLLLNGCNPMKGPKPINWEFRSDPSVKAEVYLQSNRDPGKQHYSFLNNQLSMSSSLGQTSVLPLGDVQLHQGIILTAVQVTPKGFLVMSFHWQPRLYHSFTCQWSTDICLLTHEITLRWQTIPKQTTFPHFSGIWFHHRLLQDNQLHCSSRYTCQLVQGLGYRHGRFQHRENY